MPTIAPPKVNLPGALRYQVLSGSHAYGLAGPDSDADWRGVYQLATDAYLGLRTPDETVELPPDQTYYELRHFLRLCLAGNPNIQELLWVDKRFVAVTSPVMEQVRAMRRSFFSRSMAAAYLGWVKRERLNLAPEVVKVGGQTRAATPADWKTDKIAGKPGSHLVRLLLSFRRALREGELRVTMEGQERDLLLAIKRGQMPAAEVMRLIVALEQECLALDQAVAWKPADPAPVERLLLAARRGDLAA